MNVWLCKRETKARVIGKLMNELFGTAVTSTTDGSTDAQHGVTTVLVTAGGLIQMSGRTEEEWQELYEDLNSL